MLTVGEHAPLCTLKLSHNEAKGCEEKGVEPGGYKWKDVRHYRRGEERGERGGRVRRRATAATEQK